MKLLNIREAAEFLNVHQQTIRRWDRNGDIKSHQTVGGHRRFNINDLEEFMNLNPTVFKTNSDAVVIYARTSSSEQKTKGDLDRQIERLKQYATSQNYDIYDIIGDVGSGLNDKRKGFSKLCDMVINREVNKVIIEHKDRLTRFQYNLIEKFFKSYDVKIEIVNNDTNQEKTYQEEMVEDMMMLIASFSGKLYSQRAKQNNKTKE